MNRAHHRAGLIAAMLGLPSGGSGGSDPAKMARRRGRRRSSGSMRKATRHPWGETERARRARQIERGQLRAENGLVRREVSS